LFFEAPGYIRPDEVLSEVLSNFMKSQNYCELSLALGLGGISQASIHYFSDRLTPALGYN
jgi:hypothetical protein